MPLVESFSGIRGIYDDGLDEEVAVRYAYSYLHFLKKTNNKNLKIVIGMDTRPSGRIIKNALLEVLDCDIVDIGIAPTPITEFAVRRCKADGGIIITASHNEPYWNGFKFLDKNGAVLSPEDMNTIIKFYSKLKHIKNADFSSKHLNNNKNFKKIKERKIEQKNKEMEKEYSNFVLGFLSKNDKEKIRKAKFRIIIDPNGGTGIIAKDILESLGAEVKGINMEIGIFNRIIEPNKDSLIYLGNYLRDGNYNFDAGFDCDADRVEIMTSKGLVSGNHLLALIADDILKKSSKKIIVVNNATSNAVKETAIKNHSKYIETEVGEVNVVSEMYRLKAPIGGEGSSSGVIISPSRCRDGILTLVYLLKILACSNKKLDELINELPEFYNIKAKVSFNPKKHQLIKNKIKKYYGKKGRISETKDSIKIVFKNSFIWFRASKTEANILRIISDAAKKEAAEALISEAVKLIKTK